MIQGRSAQRTTTSLSPSWLNEKVTDPPSIWAGTDHGLVLAGLVVGS